MVEETIDQVGGVGSKAVDVSSNVFKVLSEVLNCAFFMFCSYAFSHILDVFENPSLEPELNGSTFDARASMAIPPPPSLEPCTWRRVHTVVACRSAPILSAVTTTIPPSSVGCCKKGDPVLHPSSTPSPGAATSLFAYKRLAIAMQSNLQVLRE